MNSLSKNFGENIRVVRQAKGFSQENLAQMLEMSPSGYAKIERGESDITMSRAEQIAAVLDIDPAQLISMNERAFIFNIKSNKSSPVGNPNSSFHLNGIDDDLKILLSKNIETLTKLVEKLTTSW